MSEMNLFQFAQQGKAEPLAARMRPRTLDEFSGQEHLVGEGRLLRRMIQADRLTSLILYGPPGSGKTTLARIIANTTRSRFEALNAVAAGVADVRRVIQEAQDNLSLQGKRTILFIDEIHRFNKGQQDALLKAVEEGAIIFIGATTENPFYQVVSPLISRATVFRLEPLGEETLGKLIDRTLADGERGLAAYHLELTPEAREHLINSSPGDARIILNALELAALTTPSDAAGKRIITLEIMEECVQRRAIRYDRAGDAHYDVISAFIKSLRGSDPDAALYWLARMLAAGEDPLFIARRLVIQAAEDVGNADPQALVVAMAAANAVEMVGLPEGRIPLAEATVYVATAPKSNASYMGLNQAQGAVEKGPSGEVPIHLRDASHSGSRKVLGHGEGYKYPHDFPGGYVFQEYLPQELAGSSFYRPAGYGHEAVIKERMEKKDFSR